MASTRSDARPDPASSIGTLSAMALPLLFLIAALPPHTYFGPHARLLDEAVGLSHAATPVASLASALFARLPLGPLSLRVALSMALAAAVASAALFVALLRMVRAMGVVRDEVAAPLCLGACCVALGAEPMWSLSLRASPHVVGVALGCLLLERALAIARVDSHAEARGPWLGAGLWTGLLASHDPIWAACALPALWLAARSAPPPTASLATLTIGAAPMLHPLLRGFADTTQVGAPWALPGPTPLHAALGVGATVGTVAALRVGAARSPLGVLVLSLAVPALAGLTGVAGAGLQQGGGVLLLWLLLALSTLAVAALVAGEGGERAPRLPIVVALVWLALSVVQLRDASTARALSSFDTSEVLQRHAADHLPPRAVVLWPDAHRYADAAGFARASGARPDVVHVPMSHARDPEASVELSRRTPALRPLLRDRLLHGRLRTSALQTLSIQLPVAIDVDPVDLPGLCDTLLPSGGLLRVVADGATRRDQRLAAEAQAIYYGHLYENIELHRLGEPSRRLLHRLHRRDALYYMHFGDRAAARGALGHAQRLHVDDGGVTELMEALGPVDGPDWTKRIDIAELVHR